MRARQSGQATIEYILLIVIVITVAGGVLVQIFRPLDEYLRDYIGEYIYCLLDEGELPALGSEGGSGTCVAKKPQLNITGFNISPNSGSDSKKKAAEDAAKAAAAKSRSGRRGGGFSQIGPSGGKNRHALLNPRSSGIDGRSKDSNVSSVSLDKDRGGGITVRHITVLTPRGSTASGLAGLLAEERNRAKKREERTSISLGKTAEHEGGHAQRKTAGIAAELKKDNKDRELSGLNFSFSEMIRFIFICAIIGLLVFLIGSQLNSISKGLEK